MATDDCGLATARRGGARCRKAPDAPRPARHRRGARWRGAAAAALCAFCAHGGWAGERADEPESRAGVLRLVSEAGQPAPALRLAPGRATTVAFLDEHGQPIEIASLVEPEDGWLHVERMPTHPHVAVLRARRPRAGGVVAFLKGVARPLHVDLAGGRPGAATEVEVRVRRSAVRRRAEAGHEAGNAPPEQLDAAIRDYLLSNPDVLREALDPARQMASAAQRLRGELLGAAGVPASGSASAAVTVVEFFDYRCGFCKRSLDAVRMALARADVRLEMREYPILGDGSVHAAKAALAADRQGRYMDVHLALMEHDGEYDDDAVLRIAEDLGLEGERLLADMQSPEVAGLIDANRVLARKLGVSGTPAFLVAGPDVVEVAPGAVDSEQLAALVDRASR